MSRAREAVEGVKWQGTEKLWTNRVGKNWVAKRVLGRGGQGIVGHWLVSCSAEISLENKSFFANLDLKI
jgi:hypothetical protein